LPKWRDDEIKLDGIEVWLEVDGIKMSEEEYNKNISNGIIYKSVIKKTVKRTFTFKKTELFDEYYN